jgi:hypothetical protein
MLPEIVVKEWAARVLLSQGRLMGTSPLAYRKSTTRILAHGTRDKAMAGFDAAKWRVTDV